MLINCPKKIANFFQLLSLDIDDHDKNEISTNNCLILSTWNPDPKIFWLENLKSIRSQGYFNPLIILSVESQSVIYSQISFLTEGIYFLRLPFKKAEFESLFSSLVIPDSSKIRQVQDQLRLEEFDIAWKSLRHGKSLEIVNSIFSPLRMALKLDIDTDEKKKVIKEIVDGPILSYWHLPQIKLLICTAESFDGSHCKGLKIHDFFNDLSILIENMASESLIDDEAALTNIDKLNYTFREIDKLII